MPSALLIVMQINTLKPKLFGSFDKPCQNPKFIYFITIMLKRLWLRQFVFDCN